MESERITPAPWAIAVKGDITLNGTGNAPFIEIDSVIHPFRRLTFRLPEKVQERLGFVGYLRVDFGTMGKEFFSTWFPGEVQKPNGFSAEFDEVINTLRFDEAFGGILANFEAMRDFCLSHPVAGFNNRDAKEYCFRVSSKHCIYAVRLIPRRHDYNAYVFCYLRQKLEAAKN